MTDGPGRGSRGRARPSVGARLGSSLWPLPVVGIALAVALGVGLPALDGALEERGHRLLGLWTDDGLGAHTVGPLPFGHVTDVPSVEAARDLDVDVVYALLNWRAVPLAARVLRELPHLPFVFHFKEAPQACVRCGTWPELAALCEGADEVLLATEEERSWLDLALPGRLDPARTGVLDGELVATGGRVLSVVATGSDFAQARERAYAGLHDITLRGGQFRTDIAAQVTR